MCDFFQIVSRRLQRDVLLGNVFNRMLSRIFYDPGSTVFLRRLAFAAEILLIWSMLRRGLIASIFHTMTTRAWFEPHRCPHNHMADVMIVHSLDTVCLFTVRNNIRLEALKKGGKSSSWLQFSGKSGFSLLGRRYPRSKIDDGLVEKWHGMQNSLVSGLVCSFLNKLYWMMLRFLTGNETLSKIKILQYFKPASRTWNN